MGWYPTLRVIENVQWAGEVFNKNIYRDSRLNRPESVSLASLVANKHEHIQNQNVTVFQHY